MNSLNLFAPSFKITMLSVVCALSACGGGGGGGSSSAQTPPPTTQKPASQIIIDQGNAGSVARYAVVNFEALLETAAYGVASLDLYNRSANTSNPVTCDDYGAYTVSFVDKDNSHTISAGDKITFHYSSCYMRFLSALVSGDLSLDIHSFSADIANKNWLVVSTATIENTLLLESGSDSAELSGSYEIEYQYSSQGDRLRVTNSSSPFSITRDGDKDNFDSFDISKLIDSASATYSLSGEFIDAFDGVSLPCEIISPFVGAISQLPRSGELRCGGRNDSIMKFLPVDDEGGNVYLSGSSGASQLITKVLYGGATDGFFYSPVLINQPYGIGSTKLFQTNFDVAAFTFVRSTGAVFAVTSSAISTYPKQLLQIDPASALVIRTLSLPYEPSSVAITQDGNTIYVGYMDSSKVDVIDVNQWSKISQFDLGIDASYAYSSRPLYTLNIVVSPVDSGYVAVAATAQNTTDAFQGIYAYKEGVRLPNYADRTTWYGNRYQPSNYKFSANGSSLISENTHINNGVTARFTVNASGISAIVPSGASLPIPYLNGVSGDFDLEGDYFIDVTGHIYDLDQDSVVGAIALPSDISWLFNYVSLDPYTDQIYWSDTYALGHRIGIANRRSGAFVSVARADYFPSCKLEALSKNQFICMAGGQLHFIGKNSLFVAAP